MKQIPGTSYWIPDCETHYLQKHKRTGKFYYQDYQGEKLQAALKYVKKFNIAVDAGANVGFMSLQMAKRFEMIYAFEPAQDCYECLLRNTQELHANIIIPYQKALGESLTKVHIHLNETNNTGNRQINRRSEGTEVELIPLDELDLKDCNFFKLDIQGYELFALRGARYTIEKFHPVILIEIEDSTKLPDSFGVKPSDALNYLLKLGYNIKERHGVDYVLTT